MVSLDDDSEIEREIARAIEADPRSRGRRIAVHVTHGVATLTGRVDSYVTRWAADRVTFQVSGVRSVVNQIEVALPPSVERQDAEIALAASIALESTAGLTHDLAVAVEHGIVTLFGTVEWAFQKDEAERVIRRLVGVRGVRDRVTVKARGILAELKKEIQGSRGEN